MVHIQHILIENVNDLDIYSREDTLQSLLKQMSMQRNFPDIYTLIPPSIIYHHKKYKDRRVLLGKTFGGRYLFIVFQHKTMEIARPIHARDMEQNEQRIYEKQIR